MSNENNKGISLGRAIRTIAGLQAAIDLNPDLLKDKDQRARVDKLIERTRQDLSTSESSSQNSQ